MGAGQSSRGADLARLYGSPSGETPAGCFLDSRGADSSVIFVKEGGIELFHPETGDRKEWIKLPGKATCSAFAQSTSMGPILLVGLEVGTTVVYSALDYSKTLKMIRTDGAAGTSHGSPVTCTRAMLYDRFFSGHRDGSVRGYRLEGSGARFVVFVPPDDEDASLAAGGEASAKLRDHMGPVVGLAVFGGSDRPVLAVGHANGLIHTYVAADGTWLGCYKAGGAIAGLLTLPRFACIAAPLSSRPAFAVFDLYGERAVTLDLRSELESIKRPHAALCSAVYDDDRALLLSAHSDGSVLMRIVQRVAGTNDITLRLQRSLAPVRGHKFSRPVLLWYSSERDTALVSEEAGVAKVIRSATRTPFNKTERGRLGDPSAGGAVLTSEAAAAAAEYDAAMRERARTGSATGTGLDVAAAAAAADDDDDDGEAAAAAPASASSSSASQQEAAGDEEADAAAMEEEEEEAKSKAAEEEEAKRKAAEEEAKRKAAEEEAKRKAAEEEAKRKAAEEEAAKRKAAEEEAKRKAAKEAAKRKAAEEEAKRKAAEEEAAKRKAAEEEEAKRAAEEEEAKRKAAEEEEAKRRAEQEMSRLVEEEKKRKADDEEQQFEEEEAKRAAEEEAKRKAAEEEEEEAEASGAQDQAQDDDEEEEAEDGDEAKPAAAAAEPSKPATTKRKKGGKGKVKRKGKGKK